MEQYCSHCGEPLKENADFCLSCGKLTKNQPKASKMNVANISKATILMVALIGVKFIFLLLNHLIYSNFIITFISATIVIIVASLAIIVAFIDHGNRQLTKEVFILTLAISGFFIIQSFLSIIQFMMHLRF